MKPDGVNMETTEPTEAAAVAEPSSSQANITEQAPSQPEEATSDATPQAVAQVSEKPVAANTKVKPKAITTAKQSTSKTGGASASTSRPGTASQRTVNDIKSSNNASAKTAAVKKTATTAKAASASALGAVPKRPVGIAAAVPSSAKNQTKVPDKKPVGPARTTFVAAATATNGTRSATANGTAKKTVNVAKPKTTATASRTAVSTALKPGTSVATKVDGVAVLKTSRPATAPSTSRPASRPFTATTKHPTTAKTAASRVNTAPSTGRTTAAQPPKTTAIAKKDVSRPPPAAVAKKPSMATTSAATKRPEPSKPPTAMKLNTASKWSTTKAADPKPSQSKTQATKPNGVNKPAVAAGRFPALNKPPIGRTRPASPASNKPAANGNTPQAKRGQKPMQAVSPFTASKKTAVSNATTPTTTTPAASSAASIAAGAVALTVAAATAAAVPETQAEAIVALPQGSSLAASAPEEDSRAVLAQGTQPEVVQQETAESHAAAPSPPQSPVRTALPQQEQQESSVRLRPTQEQSCTPAEASFPPVAFLPQPSEEPFYLVTDQALSTSKDPPATNNATPQIAPPTNLNEEEDEEEREGSQLVSVSEMSGTTQPTEESRPGSAGPVGGSAWRVGGALLSELDSEEVSVSQQGASELSAPGVLEGTESMDDLGDGSLKGAIDMEGASAGSPDFEKVPDIPVNDYEEDEDDEDDDDRVCDMDVGSERTDEPQRLRHDNDVDDDEEDDDDEDVEMASEGVTESGLESYGNADEDDFADDERLDNLNRVAQPPPPPPQLPSAPAAQWDQPNPFADPWAEPLQPQQVLEEHVSQPRHVAGAAAASPLADPWQADSETPTHCPAQAWLELDSAPFVPENQEVPQHSSDKHDPHNLEAPMYMEQPGPASVQQTPAVAPLSAPGMSLSSTVSSETSTPEELNDNSRDGNLQPQDVQAPQHSPQPDIDYQNLDREREEEAEAETLPADEILGGPATAPTSNPTSSSVTEDEASDTEGEAQLEDSLESPGVSSITFDTQPPTKRCLSTVEEAIEPELEEVESGVAEDTTPPSATSQASYGFDTMTTASNSNAQSTGESCIRSPGIFSLEELPEEAKESGFTQQPLAQPCPAEQQYIECGKQEAESAEHAGEKVLGSEEALDPSSVLDTLQQPEENPDDIQPPYYSGICEKTENSFAGFTALPHRRDHSAYPRSYCDIVKPHIAAVTPPKLTCADLPPRSPGQQALSPQLRRLEQHQRQLQELQQRREQQNRPLEEAEQERKRRQEEEQRKKKEEAEEEIKRNKEEERRKEQEQAEVTQREDEEELKQRRDLELQLHQQQQELKQRQQIMQWQQELQQSSKGQTVLLSPSSGLCTIYEALENSEEEDAESEEEEGIKELKPVKQKRQFRQEMPNQELDTNCEGGTPDKHQDSSPSTQSPPPLPDSSQTPRNPSQDGGSSPPESPEQPPPLDLDWGKKVDVVQQLINQTLLLNGDGCSSLLLLPGGAGGTLSPLESSLWPSLLPPLTPPSATVTSVSSFSPETTGSFPQGEWTVVELETHH